MVTKKLQLNESSSDEDEHSSPPAASPTMETKVLSHEEEGEQRSEEDIEASSEDEKEMSVSSKRASEVTSSGDVKEAKRAKTNEKKVVPQRIWSAEDELIMLQGIVDFKTKTGKTTNEDKDGFYKFIKESITIPATFSQCIAKIGSLRRKYLNKVKKGKKPNSSKACDMKCFELSEKIWGSVKDGAEESRKRLKDLEEEEDDDVVVLEDGGDWFSNSMLVDCVANHGMSKESVKRLWGQVPTEKKKEMQDRWRLLQNKDAETVYLKSEFLNDVVSLIADRA